MSDEQKHQGGDELVAADLNDFINGAELYVRGRTAVCVRFDYPHVYWRWNDEEALLDAVANGRHEVGEKHRSFTSTPDIFQVRASQKRREEDAHQTQMMEDTSEEEEDANDQQHQQRLEQHQQQQQLVPHESPAQPLTPVGHGNNQLDAQPRASLMSLFGRRPEKAIFSAVNDVALETINAAAPQSVSIESSQRSRFRVTKKVTSITLLNCEDVELEFLSVISSVELIRCKRCTIRCTQTCGTFQLDDSDSCTIEFPGYQKRVLLVSTGTSGTLLVAVPGGNPPQVDGEEPEPVDHIDTEVRYALENSVEGASVVPTPAPVPQEEDAPDAAERAASAADNVAAGISGPRQLRTTWDSASAVFTTDVLVRQGPLGYFDAK